MSRQEYMARRLTTTNHVVDCIIAFSISFSIYLPKAHLRSSDRDTALPSGRATRWSSVTCSVAVMACSSTVLLACAQDHRKA